MRSGEPSTVEETIAVNGVTRLFLATRSAYRDKDGNVIGLIGISREITARKIVEDELRVQRERLVLAAEAARLGVWDYNLDADTILCDARWYEIFSIDPSPSVNTLDAVHARVHPDDLERFKRERQQALKSRDKFFSSHYRIVTPAGATRWIRSSACLIEATRLTPNRLVGIVRDVTESRLAEEKLQTQQRIAAPGEGSRRARGAREERLSGHDEP